MKIQRICTDKNSSVNDLVKVVEGDPMLTANILKSSNSPLYGFSREIKNISHAISLFGMATIRGFALSSAIKQNIKIDLSPYDLTNAKFLEISVAQSALMFNWFTKVNKDMLDILVPASFMMEVGKIIISNEIIEQNLVEKFEEGLKQATSPSDISKLEKEVIGYSNEDITDKIFEQWNLEAEIVESIRFSNTPEEADEHLNPYATALQIIKTSINIFGQLEESNITSSLEIIDKNEMSQELYLNAVEKVKQ
jgi:HD-like signal output (HDOD) protein